MADHTNPPTTAAKQLGSRLSLFELNGRSPQRVLPHDRLGEAYYGLENLLLIVLTMLADGQTSLKDLRFLPECSG